MPLGVFVPAALNDLAVDVAVGTPAQGAVFYRGAAKWNNLAAGTSGQFLKTQGAGANPIWSGLSATDLAPAVIRAPGVSGRNTVQPTIDTTPLTLKGITGQTAMLLQLEDDGANILANWSAAGLLTTRILNVIPAVNAAATFTVTGTTGNVFAVNTDSSIAGVAINRPGITLGTNSRYSGFNSAISWSDNAPSATASGTSGELSSKYTGSGTLSQTYGIFVTSQNTSAASGILTNCTGIAVSCGVGNASATINNRIRMIDLNVPTSPGTYSCSCTGINIQNMGAAGITTATGIAISAQSGATNNYSLTTAGGNVGINTGSPTQASLVVIAGSSSTIAGIVKGAASQSVDVFDVQNSAAAVLLGVSFAGIGTHLLSDATTNVITDSVIVDHTSSGTPAAGFGQGLRFRGKSSTTASRDMGRIDYSWVTATDASRAATACFWATDATADRMFLQGGTSGTAAQIGFLGAAPVVRQTGASAAGIAAITDANARTTVGALQTALANLGLVTSPA